MRDGRRCVWRNDKARERSLFHNIYCLNKDRGKYSGGAMLLVRSPNFDKAFQEHLR